MKVSIMEGWDGWMDWLIIDSWRDGSKSGLIDLLVGWLIELLSGTIANNDNV